jgi:hypothetical protein
MSDLQTFIDQAWAEHADDAAGVALRLPRALDWVTREDELMALGHLAHHVYGGHLAAWADALKYLAALARGPAFDAHGTSGRSMRQWRASLALAAGQSDVRSTLEAGERITATAQAAAALELHDITRASQFLQEAVAAADAAALDDADPAVRALAVAGNNLAANLQDKPDRSAGERELMILAAETGRRYWQRAGTWLETERAEHRLAMVWLAAGDPARARHHAMACLAIVEAQVAPPALERFFGHDALALAERAAGNAEGQARSVTAMRAAFAQLSPDDQTWCKATLDAQTA